MENVGALAVLLAFCIAIYAIVASVVGKLKSRPFLVRQRRPRRLRCLVPGYRSRPAFWFTP